MSEERICKHCKVFMRREIIVSEDFKAFFAYTCPLCMFKQIPAVEAMRKKEGRQTA